MLKKYTLVNNIIGWAVFAVSSLVYLLTMEPSVSLWDCGEFISTANKLEVGHPPGAPFFLMLGRFFSIFAPDKTLVAKMVNTMSALASGATILFLFWSITRLARKFVIKESELSIGQAIAVFGSGIVGALAYTFSDTFWFSAVEGEVYALSSLFTAIVFWAILKWEDVANQPHSDKWIILIAYLMGLSIGVHLLNLLAIPAIVFIYYFKKFKTTTSGIIYASIVSILSIAFVMYGIIQGSIRVATWFELFTVNGLGMSFNSGLVVYIILLIAVLCYGLYTTTKTDKVVVNMVIVTLATILVGMPFILGNAFGAILIIAGIAGGAYILAKNRVYILNTILLVITVIIIGYSSFAMIMIRSSANTPLDENNPENVFALLSYLNREQYGDRPLFYGQYYNAPLESYKDGKESYFKKGDHYESETQVEHVFDSRFNTLFPRMYSNNDSHIEAYKTWAGINANNSVQIRVTENGEQKVLYKPTFLQNLKFFFNYQVGHMYMRYFMWNFVGRQNDEQGHGEVTNGNWISGIDFIDQIFIGNRDKITPREKNDPTRNTYYFLPLILGIVGLVYHLKKSPKDFSVVTLLFFFTGLAIVIYLNQTPYQPRERDYAYAGSFYAFAIWIGLGVYALYEFASKYMSSSVAAASATAVCAVVPGILGAENWDDHDRSGRYIARDFAKNYLETCEPNAMIFTNGDNDTFPLWYAQEVEGVRTDVRVVCLPLFSTDWYADQMKRKAYESEALPISLTHDQYVQGTRDYLPIYQRIEGDVELSKIMEFIKSDEINTKLPMNGGKMLDYLPTKNIYLAVDSEKVMNAGAVAPEQAELIEKNIKLSLRGNYILKNEMFVLDMLSQNVWNRPMYFSSIGTRESFGLDNYMVNEGFAYRLTPIKANGVRIDVDKMYHNLVEKYDWGRMEEPDVHTCSFCIRTMRVIGVRQMFNDLAMALIQNGENQDDAVKKENYDKALKVVDKLCALMPHEKIAYDYFAIETAEVYYRLGEFEKGNKIISDFANDCIDELNYYSSLQPKFRSTIKNDEQRTVLILGHIINKAKEFNQNEIVEALNEQWEMLVSH